MASSLVWTDDVMATPGANRSTQGPVFDQDARWSRSSVAPTVMAAGTPAGMTVQASTPCPTALPLPAATTTVTPALTAVFTAPSMASEVPPPSRLMLTTAGRTAFAATQSMPATTCAVDPTPWQLSTRTATRDTFLATP